MVAPAIKTAYDVGGKILGTAGTSSIGEGNFRQIDDQASATNAAPESAAIGTQAVQSLPEATQKANLGVEQAAKIESEVGTPVGSDIKGAGLDTTQQSSQLANHTQNDYETAVQGAIKATTTAEDALKDSAQKATIDPQAYLNNMGVTKSVMSSIGMVLSGIGAGVTGQPNLAMDLYQKNLDRAIQAQAQNFKNQMEMVASKQGLIKTAQDKQQIASNAYNAAVIAVATGANVAIQGAQAQIKSATAVPLASQLQMMNDKALSEALDRHSKDFSSVIQSGNTQKINLMGEIMKPIVDQITGKPANPGVRGVLPADRIGRGLSAPGVPGVSAPAPISDAAGEDAAFQRELQERERVQAERERAITGQDTKSRAYPAAGFLDKYGGK